MCLYNTIGENPKYKPNKKNGGIIPAVLDERTKYVPFGCGQCLECRKQYAREWQVRLLEDIKHNKNGKYVTLTFSNESIQQLIDKKPTKKYPSLKGITGYYLDNQLATRAVRYFNERWRKEYKKAIRHFLITELGHNGTENIHLHGILFTDKTFEDIQQKWQYGWVWPNSTIERKTNYVSERTINYITKYITKIDRDHPNYKAIILTSAGIGRDYINSPNARRNKFNGKDTILTYQTRTGHEIALPKYWRNKLYTDEQREQLWINILNKEERWICGERVDISKTDKQYWKLLQYHRARAKSLGYRDDTIDYEKKIEEIYRRNIKQIERITKNKKQTPSAGSIQKG